MSNAFFWSKVEDGRYVVETLSQTIVPDEPISTKPLVIVVHHNDTLAAQWARCCANALNQREREMNEAHADALREQREAQQDAQHEAMADKWDKNADHDCLHERWEE